MRLYRAQRPAGMRSDLAVAHSLRMAQHHADPFIWPQPLQRPLQVQHQASVHILGRTVDPRIGIQQLGAAAHLLQGAVQCQLPQPGSECRRLTQGPQSHPCLQESLLRKVVRECVIGADAAQELTQARLATPHQFLECFHFATCRQRHECGFRHIRQLEEDAFWPIMGSGCLVATIGVGLFVSAYMRARFIGGNGSFGPGG